MGQVADADFQAHTKPCWHASAAKDLSADETDWLAALCDDDFYERISDVHLDRCPISVIRSSIMDTSSLALSVCEQDIGWPRSVVGATTNGALLCRNARCCSKGHKHKCAHCKLVADFIGHIEAELQEQDIMSVSAITEELSAVAAELQGLHLLSSSSQRLPRQPSLSASNLPVSSAKIPLDFHSPVMAARAAGKLGKSGTCLLGSRQPSLMAAQPVCTCRWTCVTVLALLEGEPCTMCSLCACNANRCTYLLQHV